MPKRTINLECQVDNLSMEALDWLDTQAQDLSWIQRRWRIWESPATDHELNILELAEKRIYTKAGVWKRPIRKRSVDVVRFASNADAMYFKLKFL